MKKLSVSLFASYSPSLHYAVVFLLRTLGGRRAMKRVIVIRNIALLLFNSLLRYKPSLIPESGS